MDVSGQLHTPTALYQGSAPITHCVGC